jgi:hypothetical protein
LGGNPEEHGNVTGGGTPAMKRTDACRKTSEPTVTSNIDHCKRRGTEFPSLTKSNLMKARIFHHDASAIDWYCELRGDGPSVVLMPSGEGDSASFQTVADVLSDEFTILTFDMPGFSRSGPPSELGR